MNTKKSVVDLRIDELPDGARYHLPSPTAAQRIAGGIFTMVFGSFFAGFAGFWIWQATGGFTGNIGNYIVAIFGLPFLAVGLTVIGLGLSLLVGHFEVELSGGRIGGVIRIGPLRVRPRRVAVDQISGLAIRLRPRPKGSTMPADVDSHTLFAELEGGRERKISIGSKDFLLALANDAARRLAQARPDQFGAGDVIPVTVVGDQDAADDDDDELDEQLEGDEDAEYDERLAGAMGEPAPARRTALGGGRDEPLSPTPPKGSRAILTPNVDGVTIEMPSAGLKGAKGLVGFAVIWNLFVGVFFFVFLMTALTGNHSGSGSPIGAVAVLGVFLLIGIVLILITISMVRRRAIIDVVHRAVLITQQGLFGVKTRQWDAGAIAKVEVGPSGTTVNNRPLMQIQVVDQAGKRTGLFTGRPDAELEWMAAHLRQALGLGQFPDTRRRKRRRGAPAGTGAEGTSDSAAFDSSGDGDSGKDSDWGAASDDGGSGGGGDSGSGGWGGGGDSGGGGGGGGD